MRSRRGFTLVELLVVVAIIALLVSILLPVLSRAKAIARKAVCASNISNHGRSVLTYSTQYDSYPFMCQRTMGGWGAISQGAIGGANPAHGWPKFYGLMQINRMKRSANVAASWGLNYYYMSNARLADMWPGSVCPAQDWVQTVMASIQTPPAVHPITWMQMHKYAMGYEWNQYLTAAVPYTMGGINRFPRNPVRTASDWSEYGTYDLWQWISRARTMPDGTLGAQQSVSPAEVDHPADVAEAWDSWDLGSTPGVAWASGETAASRMDPGWASGVPRLGDYVAFNGYRHSGACNILYADGHVASDAETDMPASKLTGNLVGAKILTWSGLDSDWGHLNKIFGCTTFGTTWR